MKNIKIKKENLQWLKIGYSDWEYFKSRKLICYSGKMILFQWSYDFFITVLNIQKRITASETL